jgi:hypothetical protein
MFSVRMLQRATFPILAVLAMDFASAWGTNPSTSETPQEWFVKSQLLIDELLQISSDVAKTEQKAKGITLRGDVTGEREKVVADLVLLNLSSWEIGRKADGVLWRLWLTTGKIPTPEQENESLAANLLQNAREYREYISKHATATEEEIVRLGLTNAVDSFGSPLWYPTMKYITEKTKVKFECIIFIDVIPSRSIIAESLPSDSYDQLSSALKKWLDANQQRMVWDPDASRFRPRKGGYVGVAELSDALLIASGKAENEHGVNGKK